ncbi:MAG TPA: HAMP domain-containing sensor histidine kinase [Flavisolibacter sp.]|nr:HAMP domain-containing sensor histidine kinase [Flavisolibacter sp.]
MEILQAKILSLQEKLRSFELSEALQSLKQRPAIFLQQVKSIGIAEKMDDYERRKLSIFNQLNFFQLVTGVLIPLIGLLHSDNLPLSAWLLACVPSCISVAVLVFNHYRKYETAQLTYFILYPFFTGFVYLKGMNAGVELHFILYGVLAVFFLQDMGYMLFTIALSMVNYFILSVVLQNYIYEVKHENRFLYLFNHLLALGFIYYGLFLIKKENTGYQFRILSKQRALHKKNLEIKKQKNLITEKARLLEIQKSELTELNLLKTKLFSVIAHDLKTPMYALRNLFRNMHQQNLPAEEIKVLVPDVLMDLNYTIGLMENLLTWSKTQMQANNVKPETLDMSRMIFDVLSLLRLQAEAKQIDVEAKSSQAVYALGDRDMVNLVLRNILSNAIKFTPQQGHIEVGINDMPGFVEVYVQDSGTGISRDALDKINENIFYTTKGTASESGTGLGLMLCKEFLARNGGQLHIESEPGKGSIFSFTLPKPLNS